MFFSRTDRLVAFRFVVVPLILLLSISSTAFAVPGDVDGDGVVTQDDVALVEAHILGVAELDAGQRAAANINRNTRIDVGDVLAIARMAEGNVEAVPNVVMEGWQRAELLIEQAGFQVGTQTTIRSDLSTGMVLQQSPRQGSVAPAGSPVDLILSGGSTGGPFLEISPTEVDLGTSGTTATFTVTSVGGDISWVTGMAADYTANPPSGYGSGTVTMTLNRTHLPKGDNIALSFGVFPDVVVGASPARATVRLQQTVSPPPRLSHISGALPVSPGDDIWIEGLYFASDHENNQVTINGRPAEVLRYFPGPPRIRVPIPDDIMPGMVEIRVRRVDDEVFGPSPWSEPLTTRLVDPTVPHLYLGRDGNSLWFEPSWWSVTGPEESRRRDHSYRRPTWILGGRNFDLLDGVNVWYYEGELVMGGSKSDPFSLEAVIDGQSFQVPANRLDDQRVAVVPHLMRDFGDEFYGALRPGLTFPARLWASEPSNGRLRASEWINLRVSTSSPKSGSVHVFNAHTMRFDFMSSSNSNDSTVVQLAQGSIMAIEGEYPPPTQHAMLDAPSLWNGTIDFSKSSVYSRMIRFDSPGTHTIHNSTTGKSRTIQVLPGGAPSKWFPEHDYVRPTSLIHNVLVPPDRSMSLFASGAKLEIPSGALPHDPDYENLVSVEFREVHRGSSFEFFDPEASDDSQESQITFMRRELTPDAYPRDWNDLAGLAKPLTLRKFYSEAQALNGPPSLGILDYESGIYWEIPTTADVTRRQLTAVFPAGIYGDSSVRREDLPVELQEFADARREGEASPTDAFPPIPLYQITRRVGIPYIRSERSRMTDLDGRFLIDYISDSNSSSYASHTYAEGILATMVAAHSFLAGRNWRVPDGPTTIYLRNTWTGGYGSTTKAVFGRPTVTINVANCPEGSAA